MKHLEFTNTPVQRLSYFSKLWGKNILCKRDDLFQKAGGGSKARMLQYILAKDEFRDADVLLTAGGPNSNFNRACALMCANLGKPMFLVEYTDSPNQYSTSLNNFVCGLAGMNVINCCKNEVPEILTKVSEDLKNRNLSVFQVYGGGKCLEGIYAYYDAVKELSEQIDEPVEEVYIACGTGTTLTGICAGFQEFFPGTTVHAISVAREIRDEKPVMLSNMEVLNKYLGKDYDFSNLKFHDEFILGGYGKTDREELEIIRTCVSREGILIDPVYSGKAFYGMSKVIKESSAKNVLFWNTGAIFNLLSYTESFRQEQAVIIENTKENRKLLLDFMIKADNLFAVPISTKVNLEKYTSQILEKGNVIGIISDGEIVAAVLFYCNDYLTRTGYISFLCCLEEYQGKGYARKVVNAAIEYSKLKGMMRVKTDSVNPTAITLYESIGFIPLGNVSDGNLQKVYMEYNI